MHKPEIEEVESRLRRAVLAHLTDEELNCYFDHLATDAVTTARIEGHLKMCQFCSCQLKMMQEVMEPPAVAIVKDLLTQLGRSFRDWWRQNKLEIGQPGLMPVAAASPEDQEKQRLSKILYGQMGNGLIRWSVRDEQDSGNLVITLVSSELQLANVRLQVRLGDCIKPMVMEKRNEEVRGRVTFSREERKHLPAKAEVFWKWDIKS